MLTISILRAGYPGSLWAVGSRPMGRSFGRPTAAAGGGNGKVSQPFAFPMAISGGSSYIGTRLTASGNAT